MGAQIAAHLVNANVQALLFELPAKEGDPNGNVLKAIEALRPAVEAVPSLVSDPKPLIDILEFNERGSLLGKRVLVTGCGPIGALVVIAA